MLKKKHDSRIKKIKTTAGKILKQETGLLFNVEKGVGLPAGDSDPHL